MYSIAVANKRNKSTVAAAAYRLSDRYQNNDDLLVAPFYMNSEGLCLS